MDTNILITAAGLVVVLIVVIGYVVIRSKQEETKRHEASQETQRQTDLQAKLVEASKLQVNLLNVLEGRNLGAPGIPGSVRNKPAENGVAPHPVVAEA
jgi:flagellar basal body-associated protein FliL